MGQGFSKAPLHVNRCGARFPQGFTVHNTDCIIEANTLAKLLRPEYSYHFQPRVIALPLFVVQNVGKYLPS